MQPHVLFVPPPGWVALDRQIFASPRYRLLVAGHDSFAPERIDYFVGLRPPHGYVKTLPNLKLVISLGAGVDAFLGDPDYPRHLPLVRFVDPALSVEMAQYVILHALIIHRRQRFFDQAQQDHAWRQILPPEQKTRIGILGLGEIGGAIGQRLALLGFAVSGWSRTAKEFPGVKSFFGEAGLTPFLGQCDILVCVLPMTPQTAGILNAGLFARLPRGAWVINVARGGHLVENDLMGALDSGHLGGAVLDVFRAEPLPADSPLWRHPKITVTPHVAGIIHPGVARAYIEDCVTRFEAGEPLKDMVDTARGY